MKEIEEQIKETTELIKQIKEIIEKLIDTFENPKSKTKDNILDAVRKQNAILDTKIVLLNCVKQLADNLIVLQEIAKKMKE